MFNLVDVKNGEERWPGQVEGLFRAMLRTKLKLERTWDWKEHRCPIWAELLHIN